MPYREQGKMRSVDTSRFAMVPRNDVPRSVFDTVHTHKTTFDGSYLVPIYVDEVLPGDSFRLRMTAFCRLATPIVPVMDNMHFETFFFFVPNRLLWDNWERFMGQQDDPGDDTDFLVPQTVVGTLETGVDYIANYMGITTNNLVANTISVNALPFRAYNFIWNEWFRDEDLQDPIPFHVDDGPDPITDYGMQLRGKRHDYFTSARPWPEKPIAQASNRFGNVEPFVPGGAMTLPQAGAPVTGIGIEQGDTPLGGPGTARWTGGRQEVLTEWFDTGEQNFVMKANPSGTGPEVRVLVNDIRTAQMVQLLMERNARGGTRYAELVRSHFGVTSPDSRLQRPEYLGGGKTGIHINPVAQTSASGATGTSTVLGELAGVATALAYNHGFSQSFTEHGVILGLCNVRGDITYQNGINRMWFRRTMFDFYWPALAHLGEQAILNKEIYVDGGTDRDNVFGYQERWAEYRYKPSRVSGLFRSTVPSPLDMWHLAENFGGTPLLDENFIRDNTPFGRVLQTQTTEDQEFLMDSMFEVRMVRALPMFSVPGMGPRL